MRPKISIIVPVFNVEKYLIRCLTSLVNQTLNSIEIIIVDDESPDGCSKICDSYALNYDNIQVIHKENEGLGFARNSGISIAKGEYIAFVDSDDYVGLDAFEKMYDAVKSNNADTCLCGFKRLKNNGNIINNPQPFGSLVISGNNNIRQKVLLNMIGSPPDYWDDIYLMMAVWMGLYSLDLIKRHSIYFCSERVFISEDIIFDLDYYAVSEKVVLIEAMDYVYCENDASLTVAYKKDRYVKQIILFVEIEKKCKLLELDAKSRINRSFIGRARLCIYSEAINQPIYSAWKNIREICKDAYLNDTLMAYNIKGLTYKQRGIVWLMKHRCSLVLIALVKYYSKIRR